MAGFTGQPGTANARGGFLWPGTAPVAAATAADPVFRAAATATTNTGAGNSSITGNLPSTTVGDINILCLDVSAGATNVDPGIPTINGSSIAAAGWNLIDSSVDTAAANTPRLTWVWRIVQAGDSAITWGWSGTTGNSAAGGVAYQTGTFDPVNPFPASGHAMQVQTPSSTSFATPSVTTTVQGLLLSVFGNRSAGTWTAPAGDTKRLDAYSSSAANFALCEAPAALGPGTYSKTGTFTASTSVGNQGIALLASAGGGGTAATATGSLTLSGSVTATPGGGATGSVSLGGSVTANAAASATGVLTLAGNVATPAKQWLTSHAGGTQYVAHRDGVWGTYGEETLEGYTAAAAYHSGLALEISVYDTSDGVWVCSHDSTTGRVFSGTNLTINSTTWATFSPGGAFVTTGRPTTLVGGNVMRRLEEILDAFPGRIFVIDNKHNLNHSALITILDAHAPGRWLAKQYYTGTAWLNAASVSAPGVWAYFYPADLANLSSTLTGLSTAIGNGARILYGLGDYSTGGATLPVQSDANTFFAFTAANAIQTWAHILGAASQKTSADGQATTAGTPFDGYMMSNVPNVIAGNSSVAATATGSLTLGGSVGAAASTAAAGSLTLAGAAGSTVAGIAGSVTLGGSATAKAQAGATGSLTLSGTAASTVSGITGGVTLVGSAAGSAPAAASGALALTGTVSASAPSSATGTLTLAASAAARGAAGAAGALTLAGSAAAGAAAAATGTLALAGTVTATSPATAAGSLALAGAASGTLPGTASGSLTLTGAAAARAVGAAGGTLSLTASAGAATPGSAAGGLTLAATAATSPIAASAAGSLILAAAALAAPGGGAVGSLTFTGTVTAGSRATATGAVTLAGTTAAGSAGTAAGSLTLAGSATTVVPAGATGAIVLTATAAAAQPGSSATGSLTLSAATIARTAATGTGTLTLSGTILARANTAAAGSLVVTATVSAATVAATAAGQLVLAGLVGSGDRDITLTAELAVQVRPFSADLVTQRKFAAVLEEHP